MSDDTNKIDVNATAPAADSTELTDESLQSIAGGTDPKEQVSLSFGKLEIKYQPQRTEGTE